MDTGGVFSGFFGVLLFAFLAIIAVLGFLLPLFVFQIKNDVSKMRNIMNGIAEELERQKSERKKTEAKKRQEKLKQRPPKKTWDELKQEEKELQQ